MKLLLSLVLLMSFSAVAETVSVDRKPDPMLNVMLMSCSKGSDSLVIELISDPSVDSRKTIATFVEYKKDNRTMYSSSSFDEPLQRHANLYLYAAQGNGTESKRALIFSWDRKGFCAKVDGIFDMCCNLN